MSSSSGYAANRLLVTGLQQFYLWNVTGATLTKGNLDANCNGRNRQVFIDGRKPVAGRMNSATLAMATRQLPLKLSGDLNWVMPQVTSGSIMTRVGTTMVVGVCRVSCGGREWSPNFRSSEATRG